MIEFKNVTKKFGNFVAIKKASFIVPDKATVALIGANGSGKTTIMRMISTILEPTEGAIEVNGFNTKSQLNDVCKQIGLMLGGDATLTKHFTARENIIYFGRIQNLTKREAEEKADILCQELKMEDYINKRVETFSRGMRQKVLLAQSLIHNPEIILMDEPSTGLDIFATIEIQKTIRDLHDKNKIILISSHNMNEIEELCEYAIVVDKGEILYSGKIKNLLQNYNATSVKQAFTLLIERKRNIIYQ